MLKFFRLMSVLSAILAPFMVEVAFSRPSLAVPNSADNKQVCHMDTTDGRIIDLSHLCGKQPKTEAPSTEAQLTEIAGSGVQVRFFVFSILMQAGLYRLASLLLQDYPTVVS
jgi:hypothetical protein